MPAYDFRCKNCKHTFTLTLDSYDAYADFDPACPNCQSQDLSRLIRRVSILTNEDTRIDRLSDPSNFAGLDEEDPRAMGRMMRHMAGEMGEDLGPELNEVIDRLESGESPESIEQSMPDLGESLGGGLGDDL